jgi:hypothetical protein
MLKDLMEKQRAEVDKRWNLWHKSDDENYNFTTCQEDIKAYLTTCQTELIEEIRGCVPETIDDFQNRQYQFGFNNCRSQIIKKLKEKI